MRDGRRGSLNKWASLLYQAKGERALRNRGLKVPDDGVSLRLSWRSALRACCIETADLITQKRRFDVLWSTLNQDIYATTTLQDMQRWFGASASIAIRRLMDEKHTSLYTTLEQMAKKPQHVVSYTGNAVDMQALKEDRSRLRQSCEKTVDLAHQEIAHKQSPLPLERRPKFGDIASAIETAYQMATKYDALLSGTTYMLTDDGSQMLPTTLGGTRFEEIGTTDLSPRRSNLSADATGALLPDEIG